MTYTDGKSGIWRRGLLAALMFLFFPVLASASPQAGQVDLASLAADRSIILPISVVSGIDPAISPADVIASASELGFRPVIDAIPHFSAMDGDVWLRFELANTSAEIRSAKLVLRFPYLPRVDLYEPRPEGGFNHSTAGAAAPVTGKAIPAAYPAFSLDLQGNETREYFARVQNAPIIVLPAILASEASFARQMMIETVVWSLIAGAVLAFSIYAASMSFAETNGAFRIYLCLALSTALYILLSSGLLNALIGTNISFNFTRIVFFLQAMVVAFGAMFVVVFLDMEKQAPRLFRIFYVLSFVGVLTGLGFLLPSWLARPAYFVTTGAGPFIIGAGLLLMASTGIAGARSVLIAWLPCLIATALLYLRILDVTPYAPINHFLLPLALIFTLAYLSAVLGGRVRQTGFWENTDSMTGLGNRRLLDQIRDLESRQPGERYGAAVAIDLDKFKTINETFGHASGDSVLVSVAEKLRTHFSGRGDIFRVGGDEFLVLSYHWHSRMDIITQADAFLQANLVPVRHETNMLSIGASIGIAFYDHRTGLAGMLRQADAELFQVKSDGGGAIRIGDQRKRDRRRSEPVLFADNDESDTHIEQLFGATHAGRITGRN